MFEESQLKSTTIAPKRVGLFAGIPNPRRGLDPCLIAVRVVNRFKGGFFSALDGGVLVERAGCVGGRFLHPQPVLIDRDGCM